MNPTAECVVNIKVLQDMLFFSVRRWQSRYGDIQSLGHQIIRISLPRQTSARARHRLQSMTTWLGLLEQHKCLLAEGIQTPYENCCDAGLRSPAIYNPS